MWSTVMSLLYISKWNNFHERRLLLLLFALLCWHMTYCLSKQLYHEDLWIKTNISQYLERKYGFCDVSLICRKFGVLSSFWALTCLSEFCLSEVFLNSDTSIEKCIFLIINKDAPRNKLDNTSLVLGIHFKGC